MSDYQIAGDVIADVSSFVRDMDHAVGKLREVDNAVDSLIRHMDELDGKSATIDIKGIDSIDHIVAKLDELDAKKATAEVEIRGLDEAKLKLDELDLKLDALKLKSVDIKIKCDDACLRAISNDAKDAEKAVGGGAGGGGGLLGAIALIAPALIPIGAVALGGIGAIAASAGIAGTGLIAFGAVAAPVFKGIVTNSQALQKVWKQIDQAKTPAQLATALQKQKFILDSMDPSMAKAVKGLLDLEKQYKAVQKSIEPQVFSIFAKGMGIANELLKEAAPLVKSVAKEVDGLMTSFSQNLNDDDVQHAIEDLTKNAANFIGTWFRAVGNFAAGVLDILDAFTPLAKSFNGGMLSMSERFREWASQLSDNKSFQNFVAYVKRETPPVLHLIGQLFTLIVNIAKALAPFGAAVAGVLDKAISKLNQLAEANPGTAKMVGTLGALGAGAISLAPQIKGLVEGIGPLIEMLMTPEVAIPALVVGLMALSLAVAKGKDTAPFFAELKGLWGDLKKLGSDLAKELKPLWEFFKAHIAGNIVIVMTNLVKIIRDILPILKPLAEILGVIIVGALEAVALAARGLTDALEFVVRIVMDVVKLIIKPFQWLYDELVGHSIIPDLIKGIIWWFVKLPIEIVKILGTLAKKLFEAWIRMEVWLIKKVADIVGGIIRGLTSLPGKIGGFFVSAYHAVMNAVGDLIKFVAGIPGKILSALGDLGKLLFNAGKNIIKGLINGIKDAAGGVADAVKGVVKDITDFLPWSPAKRGPLRDHPPEIGGKNIVKMIATGVEDNVHLVDKAIGKITKRFTPTMSVAVGAGVTGGSKPYTNSGGPAVTGATVTGSRIGVYVAPGAITVTGAGKTTEKSISDQLTRVARFGAFGNAGK